MNNFFTDLVAKLTRRQKKGKPVPVPVVPEPIKTDKVRQAPETIGTAVTYNRVDGRVSGSVIQVGGVTWDEEAKVYRGKNYVIQQEAERRRLQDVARDRAANLAHQERLRRERERREDEQRYASSTTFDDAFFVSSAETSYEPHGRSSGYDYPSDTSQPAYVAPSPSYEAPSYSSPSHSSVDSGSSSSGGGYGGGGE